MLVSRRALVRSLAVLAGGASLFALAASASAATNYSTIWSYYDAQGHDVGTAGLACDGGAFEYDGDLPEGGYAKHVTRRCDETSWKAVACYSIAAGPRLAPIPCWQLPGFGSY